MLIWDWVQSDPNGDQVDLWQLHPINFVDSKFQCLWTSTWCNNIFFFLFTLAFILFLGFLDAITCHKSIYAGKMCII